MDALLLASIAFLASLFCIIGGFIFKLWLDERNSQQSKQAILADLRRPMKQKQQKKEEQEEEVDEAAQDDDGEQYKEKQQQNAGKETKGGSTPKSSSTKRSSPQVGEELEADSASADKKLGKKKAAKLQAKAEAKVLREQQQTEREERKMRELEEEKLQQEKRLLEEAEEKQRKEKLKLEREERERRELEEYTKFKQSFSVGEHGFENEGEENAQSENFTTLFLAFIKQRKVVHVDELAAHFQLKADAIIERLNGLMQEKRITGVFDDRGLFTHITDVELHDVAKFINQRGRVSLTELAEHSNRLISLAPAE